MPHSLLTNLTIAQPMPEQPTKQLLILIPKPGTRVSPVNGSGIVASCPHGEPGLLKVDYEGNLYGGHESYWLRLYRAAARHVEHYPTIAREYHSEGNDFPFLIVGTFDYTEAIKNIRARNLLEEKAISEACDIDPTFKDLVQAWADQPI